MISSLCFDNISISFFLWIRIKFSYFDYNLFKSWSLLFYIYFSLFNRTNLLYCYFFSSVFFFSMASILCCSYIYLILSWAYCCFLWYSYFFFSSCCTLDSKTSFIFSLWMSDLIFISSICFFFWFSNCILFFSIYFYLEVNFW